MSFTFMRIEFETPIYVINRPAPTRHASRGGEWPFNDNI